MQNKSFDRFGAHTRQRSQHIQDPVAHAMAPADSTAGFTLVELVCAIGIVAILAAIAIPTYRSYVIRSRLPEAMNILSGYQIQLEHFYQDQANYGSAPPACGLTAPSATQYFTYSCSSANGGQTYTATATGMGMLAGYVYTVDDTQAHNTTLFAGSSVNMSCWATRLSDC